MDKDPAELPVGFMTGGKNVLPSINGLINAPGYEDSLLSPGIEPEFLLAESNNNVHKIHVFGGQQSFLAGAPSASETSNVGGFAVPVRWSGIYHKEVVFANNGVDPLQYYNNTSGKFEDVPGFPAGIKFQYIRRFKDYLIGIGVIDGSNIYNEEIYWSHPTTIGSTPASWDTSDPAYDAGRNVFPTERGHLLDGLELGNSFFLYKNDSIWRVDHIGGNRIFSRKLVTKDYGLIAHRCVVSYPGGHFFVGQNSIYTFNGSSMPEDIGIERVRDYLFNNLDSTNYEKMFVVKRASVKEIWVYFPTIGSEYCNKVLVWNWELNSWGFIDAPNVLHAVTSEDLSIGSTLTWNDMGTTTWQASGRWTEQINKRFIPVFYQAQKKTSGYHNLFHQTTLNLNEGVLSPWMVERKDFLLGPFSARGNVIQDYETMKIVSEIWIRAVTNGNLRVTLGGRDNESEAITWYDPVEIDPNTWSSVGVLLTHRFHAIRIESIDASAIKLQGINIRWEDAGEF